MPPSDIGSARRFPVTAQVNKDEVIVQGEWIITLPRHTAIQYVNQFNTSSRNGFIVQNDRVSLCHGMSRIFMTAAEARTIVEQIRQMYSQS